MNMCSLSENVTYPTLFSEHLCGTLRSGTHAAFDQSLTQAPTVPLWTEVHALNLHNITAHSSRRSHLRLVSLYINDTLMSFR